MTKTTDANTATQWRGDKVPTTDKGFLSLTAYLAYEASKGEQEAERRPKTAFAEYGNTFGKEDAEAMETAIQPFILLYLMGSKLDSNGDSDLSAAYFGRRLWEERAVPDKEIPKVQKLFVAFKDGIEYALNVNNTQ